MLLSIDTCGVTGTVAMASLNEGALSGATQKELAGKTYSAQLVPMIQELLAERGLNPRHLQAVVVVHGPGSFTGVRVGVSAAKALAESLRIPLLAVSRLAVLAHKAGTAAATLDAGRGEFYFRQHQDEALLQPDELRRRLEGPLAVCEESAAQSFPGAVGVDPPVASDALILALPRLLAKNFDDVALIDGNYLRRSDAELFVRKSKQAEMSKPA